MVMFLLVCSKKWKNEGSNLSRNPKILVVCQHFWPENFRINDICSFLIQEKNCDIDVLCGLPNYPDGKLAQGYGFFRNLRQRHNDVSIYRTWEVPRGNNSNLRIFLNYISFPLSSLLLIPRLMLNRYDKIFLYQLSPVLMSISGILIGKIKRVETTMYVLDLWPENLYSVLKIKNRFLRKIIENISHWHYRNVDKIIALSDTMRDHLIEVSGISAEKIIVLPQAAERIYEKEIHDTDLEARFRNGFNLLFTGSLTPAQSFNTIIDAAKILRNSGIHDINWIIVGDGMSRTQIQAQVQNAGLSDIFYFEGQKPMEDVPKYTAIADGLVGCLVKSELLEATIPAKVMSYIASGKPLVLSMDGEVQHLINSTIKGGYVGNCEDSNELAKNISKLKKLSNRERIEMGQRLKRYHSSHFERDILLNKMHQFIFSSEIKL